MSAKPSRRERREDQFATSRAALREVIEKAENQAALGAQLGVSQASVSKWLMRGWVPLKRAKEIEATYGVDRMRLVHPGIIDALAPVEFSPA